LTVRAVNAPPAELRPAADNDLPIVVSLLNKAYRGAAMVNGLSQPLSRTSPNLTSSRRPRELETDDDQERFKERLKKLVKHKPVEKP
jgi:hypothetical protein